MSPAYLNLKKSAEYLGIGYSTIKDEKKGYLTWEKYGVIPSKFPGGRSVRFKITDLDRLMEKLKIIKG